MPRKRAKKSKPALNELERKTRIAACLRSRVFNKMEISRRTGIPYASVHRYVTSLYEEWSGNNRDVVDEVITAQIAENEWDQQEAHAAWEKSKLNAESVTVKDGKDGVEESKTTKGQCGDPRYIELLANLREERRKLMRINLDSIPSGTEKSAEDLPTDEAIKEFAEIANAATVDEEGVEE